MKSKRAREAATAAEDFLPVDDAPVEKKRKRSDDEPTEVKQKKAKKDKKDRKKDKKESRKEKKDKRKDLQDLPEEEEEEEEDADAKGDAVVSQTPDVSDEKKSKKKEKKEMKEKKEKKEKKKSKEAANDDDVSDEPKKEKKDKKKKSKDEDAPTQETPAPAGASNDAGGVPDAKSSRHIVFVGNLPFTATADSIKAHFASLKPISVRCMKNKDDDKPCRGIAFVEFANVWTMRTCLDKFHHTEFEGRRINVELTAGGGGKTKFRKDKIREKNKKLDENRSKRIERERAAKEESDDQREEGSAGIHPSRLARIPGLGE